MKIGRIIFTPLLAILVLVSYIFASENFPHFSKDGCAACHVSHGSRQLIKDPNLLCKECHPDSHQNNHKVGIKTKLNRANLPLDSEGKIVCAYTCHDMHPKKDSDFQKRLLRTDPDTLCLSCHEK